MRKTRKDGGKNHGRKMKPENTVGFAEDKEGWVKKRKEGRKKKCKEIEGFEEDKEGWLKRRKERKRNVRIGKDLRKRRKNG